MTEARGELSGGGATRLVGPAAHSWRMLAPLGLMGAIFFASGRPLPFDTPSGGDKLLHLAVYGLLALSWGFALAPRGARPARLASAAALLSAAWGASDELHQSFVAGRHASIGDLAADVAGAVMGGILVFAVVATRRPPEGAAKGDC